MNLTFGEAIDLAKDGELIQRKGWNGKGMFVFIRPADELTVDFIVNKVKSLPQAVKNYYQGKLDEINKLENDTIVSTDYKVKFTEYFCMKAADDNIVNGWLANQTDMLANDWQVFKTYADGGTGMGISSPGTLIK